MCRKHLENQSVKGRELLKLRLWKMEFGLFGGGRAELEQAVS